MPDYNASTVNGTQWQRCNRVMIDNSIGKAPMVHFSEELAVNLGGRTVTEGLAGISFPFDPAETIPLLDVETGAPTGETVVAGEVYVAIHSMYIKKALERDAGV